MHKKMYERVEKELEKRHEAFERMERMAKYGFGTGMTAKQKYKRIYTEAGDYE